MKRRIAFGLCLLIMISAIAYHFLSPKVVVDNQSDKSYSALNFSFPSNDLSFSAIKPRSHQTIYFSPQKQIGLITYQLLSNSGDTVAQGQLSYIGDESPLAELGTTLNFTINENYEISFKTD
ncbi:hypothetical protein [Shewanella canadensis]|nr:hypothetical protein [Shewanella canadensis]